MVPDKSQCRASRRFTTLDIYKKKQREKERESPHSIDKAVCLGVKK
ncbi:MAG TPA: hypothetical protein V6C97_14280 [Oculatellaceae cyanobacterium]